MPVPSLLPELQLRVLAGLNGASLARVQACCGSLRTLGGNEALWRALVLHGWGWLVRTPPPARTWKWLFHRVAVQRSALFFIVGGLDGPETIGCTQCYSPHGVAWRSLPPGSEQRNMPAVVRNTSGDVVVAGGLVHGRELHALRSVERYSLEDAQWTAMPSMSVARCCCSGALDLRGRIYVVGGGSNMYVTSRAWSSVEWLEDGGAAWHPGPTLGQARCALGAAVGHLTDHLFAAGGYGGDGVYHDTAERLDLSAGSRGAWEPLPRMSCRRAGASAAVGPDNRLYVLGGGPDGVSQHSTMEALDQRERRWDTSLARLLVGRHYNAAAFGPDGCLYVAGAFRHTGQLDVAERYDPRADAWELLPSIGVPITFSAGVFVF